jgi:hypothetical protein
METVTDAIANDKMSPADATITSAVILVAEVLTDIRDILEANSEHVEAAEADHAAAYAAAYEAAEAAE